MKRDRARSETQHFLAGECNFGQKFRTLGASTQHTHNFNTIIQHIIIYNMIQKMFWEIVIGFLKNNRNAPIRF